MELQLTSDQEFFAETTRKFLEDKADVTALRALRHDSSGYAPDYWRQGCELGWTSLLVSEDDGGGSISGEGVKDLVLIAHEFGRHASPGPLIAANVVAAALSRSGSDDQRSGPLAEIIAGEAVASWAWSEPVPNDRLGTVTMEAERDGDGWRLSGTKQPVESAGTSTYLLVAARTAEGLSQFLVPTAADGIAITPMKTVDLTRRFDSVTFEGVAVPADAVVGRPGDAADDVQRQLQLANVLQCAEMVGAIDRAMDITVEWTFDRYSFGRPLASYQAIKHRTADMKAWQEASHGLADAAATAVQKGAADADELVSSAKAFIGHYGPELLQECVQFHGGIGVTFEHDIHLYLRRVALNASLFGTVTDHRLRLADILDAKGDAA